MKRIIRALVVLVVLGLVFWGVTRIISNLNLGEGNYSSYYIKVTDQKKYEAYLKGLGIDSGVNYRFFLTSEIQPNFGVKNGADGTYLSSFDFSRKEKEVVFKVFFDPKFFEEKLKEPGQPVVNTNLLTYVCGVNNESRKGDVFMYCRDYVDKYGDTGKGIFEIKKINFWPSILGNLVKKVSAACGGAQACGYWELSCTCSAMGGVCDTNGAYCTGYGGMTGLCSCTSVCGPAHFFENCNPNQSCAPYTCGQYNSCGKENTCYTCDAYVACPTGCGQSASWQPDGDCGTYFCAATAACCSTVYGTWNATCNQGSGCSRSCNGGSCPANVCSNVTMPSCAVNGDWSTTCNIDGGCGRSCVGASCGGSCLGTAPSCAVNGTWSACDINGDRTTCSATCGGTCGEKEPCIPICSGMTGPSCIPEIGNYTINVTNVFSAKSVTITSGILVNAEGKYASNNNGVWSATYNVADHPGSTGIRTDAYAFPGVGASGPPVSCGSVTIPRCLPLNCSMLSGRRTIGLGESGTYTANITSPGTAMSGEINYYNDISTPGGTIHRIYLGSNLTVPSDNISTTWTPSALGDYSVCCRAWTDPAVAECRPAEFGGIGGAVSACPGPNTCLPVTVTDIPGGGNSPPTIVSLAIKNSVGTIVPAEAGDRNQICQSSFLGSRSVTFELTMRDLDGWADIASAQIMWRGISHNLTLSPGPGLYDIERVGTYTWNFAPGENGPGVFLVMGKADDQISTSSFQPTGRSWKVWDCQISAAGTVYEIENGTVCTAVSPPPATAALNYNQTVFTGMGGATTRTFSATTDYSYSTPPYLEWGKQYSVSLNTDLSGNQPTVMRVDSEGNVTCPNVQLNINQALIDAYSASTHLTIDFGIVRTQSPWWQAVGGGVMANILIRNNIPPTCVAPVCTPAMVAALVAGDFSDGVTFGQSITNPNGSTTWSHTSPRDMYKAGINGKGEETSYATLYNKLYSESGVGVKYTGTTTLGAVVAGNGGTGVAFVDGNLNITSGNVVSPGSFLMIVVNGGITIDQVVNTVEGVLVSDEDINIAGTSVSDLIINGTIYTNGSVNISRGYTNAETNNTNMAVKFNYRPDLLFNMPVAVSKVLSNWRVGQ